MSDTISSLYEVTEETMVAAHKAGMAYWRRNRPGEEADIGFAARSLGYREGNESSFVAGYYGAKKRAERGRIRIRQTGQEYVVEEYRWTGWHIIESLPSRLFADDAAKEYGCEIV